MLNNLREQMYRYRLEYLKDRTTHAQLVCEHEAVLEALRAKDVNKAGEAIRIHIENQKQSIIQSLEARDREECGQKEKVIKKIRRV